jgi:hypothetical protein
MVAGLKTVSEANDRSHWAVKNRRKQEQQQLVAVAMHNAIRGRQIEFPCVVKLTRIGPKRMDDDNWTRSAKGVRDIIAQKLGCDDGDESKIKFEYAQMPIGSRDYAVKVEISTRSN